MGFSMSLSSFVGFIPSVTRIKWKGEHSQRQQKHYLGIQSKSSPEVMQKGQN